jgi:hypothetical protein
VSSFWTTIQALCCSRFGGYGRLQSISSCEMPMVNYSIMYYMFYKFCVHVCPFSARNDEHTEVLEQ